MTVQEVELKRAQLESVRDTALEAAKVLAPATSEFDEAYGRYLNAKTSLARIPDELAKARVAENADAIKTAGVTISEAITQLIEGLGVANLLGTPVIALRYYRVAGKDVAGKESVSMGVVFNPIIGTKGAGKAPKEAKGIGHTMIVGPDGTKYSLTKFVLAYTTEAEKASADYKYPHTKVDSKPKFDAFCVARNLTGYTYEAPGKAPEAS